MTFFNNANNPYPRSRKSVFAVNGMVGSSQPLAAQAGLDILKKGGNAIDAAVATAACLTVVEPTSNGIGSDCFAIVWYHNKMYGLNSSGPAPKAISVEKLKAQGYSQMPKFGWTPINVPGTPGGWAALVKRFGKLSLLEDLKPAIAYAKRGYAIGEVLGKFWQRAANNYQAAAEKSDKLQQEFQEWFRVFAPNGQVPQVGETWASPDHAATLETIGESSAESFYRGSLAEKIAAASKVAGGYLTAADLADYHPSWVKPLSVNYHGYDVFELPPNGQGIVALEALGLLNKFEFPKKDSVDTYHKQIEALKIAFSDLFEYVGDPDYMSIQPSDLLQPAYLDERRALIGPKAITPAPGDPKQSGTVYLCAADSAGNMVSMIQSNYMGFGSGIVVPHTGIALNNRGNNFTFTAGSANQLAGGKRSLHTIIPGFLAKDGQPIGPFGVMGGFMQPQGHVQVIMNTIDFGLDPQAALDAPRWQWMHDKTVLVEKEVPAAIQAELKARGHDIQVEPEPNVFGRGQIIWRNPQTQTYVGGSESRTDGAIAAW